MILKKNGVEVCIGVSAGVWFVVKRDVRTNFWTYLNINDFNNPNHFKTERDAEVFALKFIRGLI